MFSVTWKLPKESADTKELGMAGKFDTADRSDQQYVEEEGHIGRTKAVVKLRKDKVTARIAILHSSLAFLDVSLP